MSLRDVLSLLLHALGGLALVAPILLWPGALSAGGSALAFGLLREQAQHRQDGWIGWVTRHRLLEAAAWAPLAAILGGLLAGW